VKPIVLVHGAWHGAWCWEIVQAGLRERGVDSVAVELPFTGLADDAATVAAELDRLSDTGSAGAVVIGHSYGGLVVSEATAGRTDVGHLVYLCAFMLDAGQSPLDGTEGRETAINGGVVMDEQLNSTIHPDTVVPAFYADVDPEIAAKAQARLRSFPITQISPVSGEPWRDVASTYIVCRNDQAIHPDHQREMATRATTTIEWDTAHSPFLSHPHLVVDLIESVAKA
jgi:pimeloyl-ACP methyl ester carboxylesterase